MLDVNFVIENEVFLLVYPWSQPVMEYKKMLLYE